MALTINGVGSAHGGMMQSSLRRVVAVVTAAAITGALAPATAPATAAGPAYRSAVDDSPRIVDPAEDGTTVVIGSSRTVRLEPAAANVVSYFYRLSDSADGTIQAGTVPARPDGTADLTWTATDLAIDNLTVQSIGADGARSATRHVRYHVDGAAPTLTRSGGLGWVQPATFTAHTRMANPAEYVVTMNADEATRQVLRPAADGSATFQLLPAPRRGSNEIRIFARDTAGVQSATNLILWSVSNRPRVTSTAFPADGVGRVWPGTFTVAAGLPGTTEFRYTINGSPVTTVPAGPDGTATIAWTPPGEGEVLLSVRSVTATGSVSSTTEHRVTIAYRPAMIEFVNPAAVMTGGKRMIYLDGYDLHLKDTIEVILAGGRTVRGTVQRVNLGTTWMAVEVDLTGAPPGPATVVLRTHNEIRPGFTMPMPLRITALPTPRATRAPAITGPVAVGGVLRASTGTWTPAATSHRYQWSANGTAIPGATGATFTVPASLLGKRLTVAVTAVRTGHPNGRAVSAATVAVARGKAPAATRKPVVSGTAKVGRQVSAAVGAWSPAPGSYAYEWRVAGKVIRGATGRTLKLTSAMAGKKVTVTVIARRSGHTDGRSTSAPVTVRR